MSSSIHFSRDPNYIEGQNKIVDLLTDKDIPLNEWVGLSIQADIQNLKDSGYKPSLEDKAIVQQLQERMQLEGDVNTIRSSMYIGTTTGGNRFLFAMKDPRKPFGVDRPEMQQIMDEISAAKESGLDISTVYKPTHDYVPKNEEEYEKLIGAMCEDLNDNEPTNLLSKYASRFDKHGRLDLNGDGVGGFAGLIKAFVAHVRENGHCHCATNKPVIERPTELTNLLTGEKFEINSDPKDLRTGEPLKLFSPNSPA